MLGEVTLVQIVGHMSVQDKAICDLLYEEYTDKEGFVQTRHIDKSDFVAYEVDMDVGLALIQQELRDTTGATRRDKLERLKALLDAVPEGIHVVVITIMDDV